MFELYLKKSSYKRSISLRSSFFPSGNWGLITLKATIIVYQIPDKCSTSPLKQKQNKQKTYLDEFGITWKINLWDVTWYVFTISNSLDLWFCGVEINRIVFCSYCKHLTVTWKTERKRKIFSIESLLFSSFKHNRHSILYGRKKRDTRFFLLLWN